MTDWSVIVNFDRIFGFHVRVTGSSVGIIGVDPATPFRFRRQSQTPCSPLAFPRRSAEFSYRSPSNEGAGNAGCALHPRSRAECAKRRAHGPAGEHPTFLPHQWLYGLSRLTPEYQTLLTSVALRKLALRPGRALVPPQDLTPTTEASVTIAVRFSTARLHVPRTAPGFRLQSRSAHDAARVPIPSQRSVTVTSASSLRGQDGGILTGDLGFGKSEILPDGLICRRPNRFHQISLAVARVTNERTSMTYFQSCSLTIRRRPGGGFGRAPKAAPAFPAQACPALLF